MGKETVLRGQKHKIPGCPSRLSIFLQRVLKGGSREAGHPRYNSTKIPYDI